MASRMLVLLLVCVLFSGLLMQIGWLSSISRQSKEIDGLAREIAEMNATADNLRVTLSQYHNLDVIQTKATELGMTLPDNTQIRVINLPAGMGQETSAQAVGLTGGNEKPE